MYTVLFDIDGTLISTAGAGRHAMTEAVHEEFGVPADSLGIRFAGRTDRAIVSDFFCLHGVVDNKDHFERLCDRFLIGLGAALPQRRGHVLPGVVDLLNQLSANGNVRLGLLTGNLRRAARIKLDHYRLAHLFYNRGSVLGGFGDRHHDRNDIARDLFAELGETAEAIPDSIWVVGDTPQDIGCARSIGARALAVATGGASHEALAEACPDLLLNDFTECRDWVRSLS